MVSVSVTREVARLVIRDRADADRSESAVTNYGRATKPTVKLVFSGE
jgi:hypothetical protein